MKKILIILFVLILANISLAEVPHLINYQGRLTDATARPYADGTYNIRFGIWKSETSTNLVDKLWGGTQSVVVTKGVFSAMIGGIPTSVFDIKDTWLEMEVELPIGSGNYVKLTRQRLVTVPYAYHSAVADSVTGGITVPGLIRIKDASLQFQDTTQTPPYGMFDIVSASNRLMFRRITSYDWSTAAPGFDMLYDGSVRFYNAVDVDVDIRCQRDISAAHNVYAANDSQINRDLFVLRDLYVFGRKYAFTVDVFKNTGTTPIHTGDLVKLSETGIVEYWGKDNMIPISGIVISDTSEDTKVIGFVSGKAKGFKKGEEPKEGEDLNTVQPEEYVAVITLGSFAICKVDATNGPIKIGDLLTSSSNPGYAMKAKEPKIGTIIGKALQNLDSGTGTIGVLVGIR